MTTDDPFGRRDRKERSSARALEHPMRVRILERLQGRAASPTDLAREFGESLGRVAYHAQILLEADCIEQVPRPSRDGALEHFYTALPRSPIGPQD